MESLIYGMLLGDSSISLNGKSKTPHLVTQHGWKQLNYLLLKKKMLGHTAGILHRITGYGSHAFRFSYYNSDLLHDVYDTCIENGNKKITQKWLDKLDDISLSIWYQDDGSMHRCGKRTKCGGRSQRISFFHTQGFDLDSNNLLAEWLRSKGYDASVRAHKQKYNVIRLTHSSTMKLWFDIRKYTLLDYKIDNLRGDVDFCSCGKTKLYSQKICNTCAYALVEFNKDVPSRQKRDIIDFAKKRFKTSSFDKIRTIKITHPDIFRFDPIDLGAEIKQYVPTSEEVESIHRSYGLAYF